MKEILVVANRTLGGKKLLDLVRERAAGGDVRFRLVVPQSKPSAGLVVYDEAVRESAQVRVDLAISLVSGEGMDAIAERRPDEIILSTHPATQSGWLRRDLIERIENASGLPVEHVVTDLTQEDLQVGVTLVVANKTASGEELLEHLREKAADGKRHVFIAVIPLQDGSGAAPREARARLAAMLARLHDAELLGSGMIGDPDPYTAAINALELFTVDDVVISTLPGERSGWMRSNLVERVRQHATSVKVEHVVVDLQANTTATAAAAS
jgi:hypothetical protein